MSGSLVFNRRTYTDTTDVQTALSQGLLSKIVVLSQEHYECQVCGRSMAGVVPAEAHLKGAPHFKALRNYNHSAPLSDAFGRLGVSEQAHPSSNTQATNTESMFGLRESESDKGLLVLAKERNIVTSNLINGILHMTCTVCNIPCTGEEPMTQHLKGDRHNKRMRYNDTLHTLKSFPEQPMHSSSSAGNESGDILKIAMSSGIVTCDSSSGPESLCCKICIKSCTGSVPMKAHLESQAHIKKARLLDAQPDTRTSQNTLSSLSSESYKRVFQELQEQVSSHVLTTGFQSQEHIREHNPPNSVEDAKASGFVIEADGLLICLICSNTCSGLLQMSDHLSGVDHRQKYKDHIEYELLFNKQYSKEVITPILRPTPSRQSVNTLVKNDSLQPGASTINEKKIDSSVQDAASAPTGNALQLCKKQRVSPDLTSHSNSQNMLRDVGIHQQRKHKLALPENLCDLIVFFPDDPISGLM